jgi:hypothetical protein
MTRILIGSDPEIFVMDENGQFRSGHDLIPGTKEQPHPVPCGAIQVDGVACEFNIDPASTAQEFSKNIRLVMNSLEEFVKGIQPGYSLEITPTAHFEKIYFESLPEEVKKLGCTPDFCAYTGEENESPETTEPFRTGAGHIHIGWGDGGYFPDEQHMKTCIGLVKELDCSLYASSLMWDHDTKRRSLYGKVGAFRPKPYGLEYRPLSNAYLTEKKTQEYVFEVTKNVASNYFSSARRISHDPLCGRFVENILLEKVPGPAGLAAYVSYIEKAFKLPVYRR